MNGLPLPLILAETAPNFRYLHGRFHEGGPGFGWTEFFWTSAVVLSITLAVWLMMLLMQRREQRSYHSPKRLFRELCNAHRLNWSDRRLLLRLAGELALAQPAALFLRPELFSPPHLPASLAKHDKELSQLHQRIFAQQSAA